MGTFLRHSVYSIAQNQFQQYLGRSPHWSDLHKNCVVSDVLDVIICAKFRNEIFTGYDFTGGQIFHFPIDFSMGQHSMFRFLYFFSFLLYCEKPALVDRF